MYDVPLPEPENIPRPKTLPPLGSARELEHWVYSYPVHKQERMLRRVREGRMRPCLAKWEDVLAEVEKRGYPILETPILGQS